MSYIDGFLIPVANANKEKYLAGIAQWTGYCKALGALRVVDYWGDDVPDGKLTSFPMAVKLEPGETVVLSWVEWPDKATRDAGNAKMREDPTLASMEVPFDGKRMIFGGFSLLSEV
jgi:uncharacterized protein YbaA (DUF1428 family)